ncbi:FimB/Mfa2 family fimbrial subunit [Alistipes sp. OttesenSCG-928-L06]|nr:FimB/Mfa2 family fimbrial subunit [Alistipes sp. OttesenSCG-928-L06]
MKILLRSFLMLLAPMLALTGCTMETEVGPVNPNAGEAQVTFRVELPTHSKPETRGTVGTVDENAVNNIYVLAFDQSGNFAYSKKVTSITEVSSTNNQAKTFKASLITSADASDKYTFVLLANVGGETVAQITALTKTTAKAAALNSLTYTSDTAPLTGIPMASVSTAPIQVTASTTISDIKLIRMTARLDVTTALANYRIAEVNLYDYNKRGKVVSNNISAANLATSIDLPSAPEKTKGPVVAANTGSNLKIFENRLYTYEASNATNKPCLVVKLEYSADGSTNWTSHGYYKLPFRQSGTPVDIKRNTRYVFSISQVTGEGFPDKEDAYKSEPVGIDTEVLEWDDTDLSGIVVSGNYFLAVGPTEFDLWKEASGGQVKIASNLPLQSGVQWTATVYDNIGGTSSTNSSWLTLTNSTGGVVYTDATKQKSDLNFTVAENSGAAPREAWIHIKGGSVVFKVRVTQSHLPDPNAVTPPTYPTPPTAGVKAPENILAVNNLGELNLDGQTKIGTRGITSNLIVYFKWGSTVAIAGDDNDGDTYDLSDIAWIPNGFTGTITDDWTTIPYADYASYPTSLPAQNNAAGLGDPCKLAGKSSYSIGDYRMPTGRPYEKFYSTSDYELFGSNWKSSYENYGAGLLDPTYKQFYPAIGHRRALSGMQSLEGADGYYWTSTASMENNANPDLEYNYGHVLTLRGGGI